MTPEKRNDIFEMIDNAVSICSDDDWLKVSLDLQYYLVISFFKIIYTLLFYYFFFTNFSMMNLQELSVAEALVEICSS